MTVRGRPRFAVLGSPISHSQSPALHAAAYRVLGFDAGYGSAEVGSGGLSSFIDGLSDDWRGLSLTMPLKEEVLPLLDSADRLTTLAGAANTVLFTDDVGRRRVDGFNTDVAGIVNALADGGVHTAREVLLLGAGATARSAVVAAASLGAQHITVAVRNAARAESVARTAEESGVATRFIPLSEGLARTSAAVAIITLPV
ncbi:MAG: shikimate dehydrogenase, partial [Subtercola sp.]|nr:shikimate dehydrogenase [Subtercola sp.]